MEAGSFRLSKLMFIGGGLSVVDVGGEDEGRGSEARMALSLSLDYAICLTFSGGR